MMCAQPVPLHAGQGEELNMPTFFPVPWHSAHFTGGLITSTLPFPPQAEQILLDKTPTSCPCPSHSPHFWGEHPWALAAWATGFPQ
jgi:hypothetical protein